MLQLDELATELQESRNPERGIDALFGIFEKHSTDGGAYVFQTILHGLETLEYEQILYNSHIDKLSHIDNYNVKTN